VVYGGPVYTSTEFGATWSSHTPADYWNSIASSADGTRLVASVANGPICLSTNSGTNWRQTSAPITNWASVGSSARRNQTWRLRAAGLLGVGPFYTSSNSGATWTQADILAGPWDSIASSADGTRLIVAAYGGPIFTSTNSGTAWTSNNAPNGYWNSVASSANGSDLVAALSLGPGF